ncbi:MAG: anthranilate phosphoribosyltransferase [Acidobacteria bacterium]|nr:MAG: anthranilate phosphoribosyltransferase [Acidobacteriota bacterium]REK07786.1 MAG: anthranilate phosphoribosyltransferase [Acidobacteriota bacterium]
MSAPAEGERLEPRRSLEQLIKRNNLGRERTEELFGRLMDGELNEVEKAALLVALACKGETPEEIAGAATAMRRRAVRIPHGLEGVIDTCGTGGDGSGSFNVSTAAALVAAAAGARVAKHGNRSISSRSGSADVLAELGVTIELPPEELGAALHDVGISFLFAPRMHPAMREVMPVRQQLGVRTLFNVLGPLTNPAGARRQLIGVYSHRLVAPIGQVLLELGSEHALVVHGSDGLDELTTTGVSFVAEVKDGDVELYDLRPEAFGIERAAPAALQGGSPAENAERMRRLLAGEAGPLADITALNAGAALYVGAVCDSLEQGIELARQQLRSGAAARKLEELVAFGQAARRRAEATGGVDDSAGAKGEAPR